MRRQSGRGAPHSCRSAAAGRWCANEPSRRCPSAAGTSGPLTLTPTLTLTLTLTLTPTRHFRAGQLAQAAQRWGSQGKMGQKWVGRYFAGKAAVLVQRRWRIQLLLRYSVLVQQRHTRGNLVQVTPSPEP